MPPGHEEAWSDALAQEHLHQRELLETLRNELGSFARECAAALTALDAYVGLAGVSEILTSAQASTAHARLALEVGRRLHGGEDAQLVDLYTKVADRDDVPPALVRHASDLLSAGPKRTDRQLLEAVVTASGASAGVEQIVGPAPWAAIAALKPLAKWIRADDRGELLRSAPGELAQVLSATATLGAGAGTAAAGDAAALTQSLREAVDYVEGAARTVREGTLESVLREARATLEADLDTLRSIHEGADEATEEWRAERRAEHAALTEEVREKLEKVERIRGVLLRILPNLQAVTRALGVVQRVHALEGRLDPAPAAAVAAAQSTLVLDGSAVWDVLFGSDGRAPRVRRLSRRTRWIAGVAAVVVAAVVGVALAGGGSTKPKPVVTETNAAATPPPTTTSAAVGPKPSLLPVKAAFDPTRRATFYTVGVEQGGEPVTSYRWTLTTPPGNPTCDKFAAVPGKPNEAVWHHAGTDGCTHNGIQHDGTVHVAVLTSHWSCTESFFGTLTRTGSPNEQCTRRE
ncbi:MAG TPA: hypothetical protein VJQ85_05575 [Gaiellaceae bacterium]|nr:hypothetical protein [Gaiellaceae bacterium]